MCNLCPTPVLQVYDALHSPIHDASYSRQTFDAWMGHTLFKRKY